MATNKQNTVRKIDVKVARHLANGYIERLLRAVASRGDKGLNKNEYLKRVGQTADSCPGFHDELKFCCFNRIIPNRVREGREYRYFCPDLASSLKRLSSESLRLRPEGFVFDDAVVGNDQGEATTPMLSQVFKDGKRINSPSLPQSLAKRSRNRKKELETRISLLESELKSVKRQLPKTKKMDLVDAAWGLFAGDPIFQEAMKLGREYRESLRPDAARYKTNRRRPSK